MGCRKKGHIHTWPTKGTLTIQRCEVRCNFCTGDAAYKDWKYAWFLRRHVRAIHVKKGKYKGMRVDAGWDDENPRDPPTTRRGSMRIKPEPTSEDDGEGIPQTVGELVQGPMPGYIPQLNFDNVEDATYEQITGNYANGYGNDLANDGHDMSGAPYGNFNAQLPTLAGEDPLGMINTHFTDQFQEWLDETAGYDGGLDESEDIEDEPEQVEDQPLIDIDSLMGEDGREPAAKRIPASSSGKFFMSDFSAPEIEDEEDDMPLAARMENYNLASNAPTDQAHKNILQMMEGFSDTIHQSGMDAEQVIPVMNQFMRSLHEERHASFPY